MQLFSPNLRRKAVSVWTIDNVQEPWYRGLALEMVRELRARGMSWREIGRSRQWQPAAAARLNPVALARLYGLTAAQSRVAYLIAKGLTSKAIARALDISPHTVRRHTERVMSKLGVSSRRAVANRLQPVRPDDRSF